MMMTMDQSSGFDNPFAYFNKQSNLFNQSTLSLNDPDVDWSVFENADRYLLRDDSAWITRLSEDFWWNLDRISELTTNRHIPKQQTNSTNNYPKQGLSSSSSSSMQSNGTTARKIIGQRSTVTRPNNNNNIIPEKTSFSSIYDQDNEYNPFQSKIFDNNIWTNYFQQAIPRQ